MAAKKSHNKGYKSKMSKDDLWYDVMRTPKTKADKQFPAKNWMDKTKRDLSKVSKKVK
jgi:hypothetical protein